MSRRRFGSVDKLPSARWRARYQDRAGDPHSRLFRTKADASSFLATVEADLLRGDWHDPRLGRITFGQWCEEYWPIHARRLARKTLDRDRTFLDLYVLPHWAPVRLVDIEPLGVEQWVVAIGRKGASRRGRTLAPRSVEQAYLVFAKLLRAAHRKGRVATLPLPAPDEVPIPRRAKTKPVRFLEEKELAHLAVCMPPAYEPLVYVAGYSALRMGELAALRLDDVDWTRGTIRVDEAVTDVRGHLEFEPPKTQAGCRVVPLADLALEHLRAHIDARVGWQDSRALVFTSPEGTTLRLNTWRRRFFNPAVAAAELAPLTPHDLRHTGASLLIAAGANAWLLAEILGHVDTRMIDRVYGHLFDKDRESLRQRMSERARAAASDEVRWVAFASA